MEAMWNIETGDYSYTVTPNLGPAPGTSRVVTVVSI